MRAPREWRAPRERARYARGSGGNAACGGASGGACGACGGATSWMKLHLWPLLHQPFSAKSLQSTVL